jgi:hypothetical protein
MHNKELNILKRENQKKQLKLPLGYKPQSNGKVQNIPILGGLCNHYVRHAA